MVQFLRNKGIYRVSNMVDLERFDGKISFKDSVGLLQKTKGRYEIGIDCTKIIGLEVQYQIKRKGALPKERVI